MLLEPGKWILHIINNLATFSKYNLSSTYFHFSKYFNKDLNESIIFLKSNTYKKSILTFFLRNRSSMIFLTNWINYMIHSCLKKDYHIQTVKKYTLNKAAFFLCLAFSMLCSNKESILTLYWILVVRLFQKVIFFCSLAKSLKPPFFDTKGIFIFQRIPFCT